MSIGTDKKITNVSAFFLEPANPTHRQYEALRAYFVEGTALRGGRPPLRLFARQLPGVVSSVPPGPASPFLSGAEQRPQDRPEAGPGPPGGHRPTQAEPLDLRHQRSLGGVRSSAQPGRGGPDSQGGGFRPVAPTPGRGTPRGDPAHRGGRGRRPPVESGAATASGRSSAGCFCFCRTWRQIPFDKMLQRGGFSGNSRWSPPAMPCDRCWP